MPVKPFPTIKSIRTFIIDGAGSGGDYHNVAGGHWLIDSTIATPMSRFEKYKYSRTSWGINVLGSFCVEITASDGTTGFATGFGGSPACWIVSQHLERFLIGADPRNLNLLWDQMFRATMFYGRKGLPIATISAVDLALWDLLGNIRGEPVYKMIGGATREVLDFYCTGPEPVSAREMGFFGAKVPIPYGPDDGAAGLKKNIDFLRKHRESVGPDYPLMVDCYMALDVPYTIQLATATLDLNISWWEECLHPDDSAGFAKLKQALPQLKFTTGEHEYTKYGFRKLIEGRNVDILQPDVTWVGGLTELLKVSAQAAAYDIPVVPHASGPYSYHYVVSQSNCPFQEYLANSPDGKSVMPVFGNLFLDEPIPINGKMQVSVLDKPGFGLTLNPKAPLIDAAGILNPSPDRLLNLNETRVLSPVSAPQAPQTVEPQAETVVESQTETVGSKPAVVGSHPQLLIGKNVAITGGATGIGRAIALKMALHGANISINFLGTAKDEISQVESLAREIEAIRPSSFLAVPGDISQSSTSKDLVAKTVDKFGRIDVLVANAGIFQPAEFLTTTEETYQKHMRINMDGVFYAIQAAANQMKRQGGGGSIIGLSSISAIVGGSNQAHYAPTKAGILSLMQTTASALGKYGIRCNALLPGTVQTQMTAGILAKEGVRKSTEAKIPLGRLGVPEDVSGPAVFLASDLSSYVTGAQLVVDGGLIVNFQ